MLTVNGNTLTFFNGNGIIGSGTGTITCSSTSNILINKNGAAAFGTLRLTPGSTTLNDLIINMTGAGNAVALGSNVTVNDTLTLTNGSITPGVYAIAYGAAGVLKYNNSTLTATTDVEFPASNGPMSVFIKNASPTGISLHANRTLQGNLTITGSNIFIIPSLKQMSVSGTLTNSAGTSGLVINSDATGTGSLIFNTSGVNGTMQRFISHWTDDNHGWHFLSSPVTGQAIQPNFVPSPPDNLEDFYAWDEVNGWWFNSKDPGLGWVSTFDAGFVPGKGYLVAYQTDVTKTFAGTLNVADVPKTGLTFTNPGNYTGTGIDPGWNLMGNPFTSAITWNSAGWSLSNIAAIAKVWSESNASYTDLNILTGGIIPPTQGFMVNVTSGSGSLTIPAAARTHNTQNWYKSTGVPVITLVAHNLDAQTAQESVVMFDAQATPGYDPAYDSRFFPGYAPQFYSVDGTDKLSTNVQAGLDSQTTIPFTFIKTAGTSFSIEATRIDNIPAQVYLTDLKLNQTRNLGDNPVYTFTASAGDDPARFLLSFSHVGIGEKTPGNNGIYSYESNLYVVNPGRARLEVYNLTGQMLLIREINSPVLYKTTLDVPTGYYMVRLTTGLKVVVTKVFIQS